MEGAGILSELHPVAAGVYNTAVFVIIPHRKGGAQNGTEHFGGSLDKENSGPSTAKPKYTYRELIKKALLQKQFLNLGGIYKWICTNFPYYSVTDDKWKNSIRHNLSLYPEFVKGAKTQESSGHLWHLDTALLQQRSTGVPEEKEEEVEEEEDVEEEEQEEEDEEEMMMVASLEERLSHPQTELQKCATEILAGVWRPTAVEAHYYTAPPLYSSAYCSCSYSSLLQEEEESWRNT